MDFPQGIVLPNSITTYDELALGDGLVNGIGSTTIGTGNLGVLIPVRLPFACYAKRLFCVNGGTVNGNVDVAIYNHALVRLTSAGSTVQSGTNQPQFFNITDLDLAPGRYYVALAASSSSATFIGVGGSGALAAYARSKGVCQMASAFPLPDPFVPAGYTSTGVLPMIGFEIGRLA